MNKLVVIILANVVWAMVTGVHGIVYSLLMTVLMISVVYSNRK